MRLWSCTTTVRNPERLCSFLQVFKELEGKNWTNDTQKGEHNGAKNPDSIKYKLSSFGCS